MLIVLLFIWKVLCTTAITRFANTTWSNEFMLIPVRNWNLLTRRRGRNEMNGENVFDFIPRHGNNDESTWHNLFKPSQQKNWRCYSNNISRMPWSTKVIYQSRFVLSIIYCFGIPMKFIDWSQKLSWAEANLINFWVFLAFPKHFSIISLST